MKLETGQLKKKKRFQNTCRIDSAASPCHHTRVCMFVCVCVYKTGLIVLLGCFYAIKSYFCGMDGCINLMNKQLNLGWEYMTEILKVTPLGSNRRKGIAFFSPLNLERKQDKKETKVIFLQLLKLLELFPGSARKQ